MAGPLAVKALLVFAMLEDWFALAHKDEYYYPPESRHVPEEIYYCDYGIVLMTISWYLF